MQHCHRLCQLRPSSAEGVRAGRSLPHCLYIGRTEARANIESPRLHFVFKLIHASSSSVATLVGNRCTGAWQIATAFLAEWSKAVRSGRILHWRGFESLRMHMTYHLLLAGSSQMLHVKSIPLLVDSNLGVQLSWERFLVNLRVSFTRSPTGL